MGLKNIRIENKFNGGGEIKEPGLPLQQVEPETPVGQSYQCDEAEEKGEQAERASLEFWEGQGADAQGTEFEVIYKGKWKHRLFNDSPQCNQSLAEQTTLLFPVK